MTPDRLTTRPELIAASSQTPRHSRLAGVLRWILLGRRQVVIPVSVSDVSVSVQTNNGAITANMLRCFLFEPLCSGKTSRMNFWQALSRGTPCRRRRYHCAKRGDLSGHGGAVATDEQHARRRRREDGRQIESRDSTE